MSGGSLNYAYMNVEEAADAIQGDSPLYNAFATHLRLVAKALHDVEWVLSGDYGKGDDKDAIMAVIQPEAIVLEAHKQTQEKLAALLVALSDIRATPQGN